MKKEATIYVTGIQSVDGEKDKIEFSSEGTVEKNDKGLKLTYHEMTDEGESSQTVLTLVGETIKIDRSGSNEMTMTVQKGRRRGCTLSTPVGPLVIGTFGTALTLGADSLSVKYDLDMNSVLMSKNELHIKYIPDN